MAWRSNSVLCNLCRRPIKAQEIEYEIEQLAPQGNSRIVALSLQLLPALGAPGLNRRAIALTPNNWLWHAPSAALEADHAPLVRNSHRLGTADGIELGQDRLDVSLRGAFSDREATRDVLVAAPLGDQLQHVELALSQAGLGHALQRFRGN